MQETRFRRLVQLPLIGQVRWRALLRCLTLRRTCAKACARLILIVLLLPLGAAAAERAYRLPSVDLRQNRVLWQSVCEGPDGIGLSFGGQDQQGEIGPPPTRIRIDGRWCDIRDELRERNALQPLSDLAAALGRRQKDLLAQSRHLYFEGRAPDELAEPLARIGRTQAELGREVLDWLAAVAKENSSDADNERDCRRYVARQRSVVQERLSALAAVDQHSTPEMLAHMSHIQQALESAAGSLSAEPPSRALSSIVYEPKSQSFVLFGGDHCDYLTNDLWTFDWPQRRWKERHSVEAPPPRANHQLQTGDDGTIRLSGGYRYTSSTDYVGGQYADRDDGLWTFDLAGERWNQRDGLVPSGLREYRTGPLHPAFYLSGDRPDAASTTARWALALPNQWLRTHPPQLPKLNRDWGTAVLDPDRDVILRFSGGHSAHGGSDVLHFHLASNRWELPFPVEFPLGQLYDNTEYPEGFNLNGRPWVTGHTYQSYGYDPQSRQMLFVGQQHSCYVYDPAVADWIGRLPKPQAMTYGSCYYTLTICPTPEGLVCWTQQGDFFRFDAARRQWIEIKQVGGRLPGSSVDNSTVVYDSRRRRLLMVRKDYGDDKTFDGQWHTLDPATGAVGLIRPVNAAAAHAISYLCQIRYDVEHDLMLIGATLPPENPRAADAKGERRTPAYDCATDRWISLALGGDDPNGPQGRNVSLGLMYDARRKVFWAVDTDSEVYLLKLDPASADRRDL